MNISNKQIESWKEQFGVIYQLPVDDKVCYLREPNMVDWKRAFTAMQKTGETGFTEEMLAACWLEGDTEIKTEDSYFLAVMKEIPTLFNYEDAIVTKLENSTFEIAVLGVKCVVRAIGREDLKLADRKNPSAKPFVTQEMLFDIIVEEKDAAYDDRNNANIRFPLYKAIEDLQKQKVAVIKKL